MRLGDLNLAGSDLRERIELRPTPIEALDDTDSFDAVWLAGPFLPFAVVPAVAAKNSYAALHPGGRDERTASPGGAARSGLATGRAFAAAGAVGASGGDRGDGGVGGGRGCGHDADDQGQLTQRHRRWRLPPLFGSRVVGLQPVNWSTWVTPRSLPRADETTPTATAA